MVWRNGEIDLNELVVFKRGRNSIDGDWYHALTPATLARHEALVRRAYARTGRTLEISEGFGAYRPVAAQIRAKEIHGIFAATPRTSSHGGYWERTETLAMDYGNWAWVYENHGGRAAFYEDQRAVGLVPGMISEARGYPDEPWHSIDPNPKSAVPAFADAQPLVPEQEEDEDMQAPIIVGRDSDGAVFSIPMAGKVYQFPDQMTFERYRGTLQVLHDNGWGVVVPPPLATVVFVTQERVNDIIYAQGAFS